MRKRVPFPRGPAAVLAGVLLALPGCIKHETVVAVNPDGSGQLIVSRSMSPQTSESYSVARYAGRMRGATDSETDPLLNEKTLKAEARLYGKGVSFVKASKVESAGRQGVVALYAFKDINQVRLSFTAMNPMMSGTYLSMQMRDGEEGEIPDEALDEMMDGAMGREGAILFAMKKGDTSTLQVIMPACVREPARAPDEATEPDAEDEEDGGDEDESDAFSPMVSRDAQEQAMLSMYRGASLSIAVEPRGTIVSRTAAHPAPGKPGRFTLVRLDFDEATKSKTFTKVLQEGGGYSSDPTDMIAVWKGMPGFVVETNREVKIVFK
jgi:hypothetical protein